MEVDAIDWAVVIGDCCHCCGKKCGYRQIRSYCRGVVEVFPFREGSVPVACFRCRNGQGDFSLLPYQLAPYHRYTIASILGVLVVAHVLFGQHGQGLEACVLGLDPDCRLLPNLLRYWLATHALQAARRAYSLLGGSLLNGNEDLPGLAEHYEIICALGARKPFCFLGGLRNLIKRYSERTRHHFLGTPSQMR